MGHWDSRTAPVHIRFQSRIRMDSAAFHGRRGVVTALLVGGADPALCTEQDTKCFPSGCTAADISARSGHDLLAAYLQEVRLEPSKILRLPPPVRKEEPRYLYTYRRYLSTNRQGLLKAEGTHHPVEFEKGLKSDVTVYESDNHHQQNCPFHILQLYIDMDHDSQEPLVKVFGEFLEDNLPPNEANPLFVFGDLVVSAERVSEGLYKSIFLPNLPGGYDFYVSLYGITPISQILKIECPSRTKKMSDIEVCLFKRLAKLLVANDDNLKCLSTKFGERNMKKLPNEVVMRELVKQWIFEGCKIGMALDEQGQGVLHLVASLGFDWAIALYARNGFPVDYEDAFGWTALHWAAYYGRKEAAMALLISGTDPSVLTKPTTEYPNASKAADIARSCGHDDVAVYLEKGSKVQRKRMHPLAKRGKSSLN